ncbi:MAG: DUF1722 domain-containing protein [Peptoniphilaceae bacterium]
MTKNIEKVLLEEIESIRNTDEKLTYIALVDFHSRNKYLYFCYNTSIKDKLGRIVANNENLNFVDIYNLYYNNLLILLREDLTMGKVINALTHIAGYFKNDLKKLEKDKLIYEIENLSHNKDNLPNILKTLKNYALKYKKDYILKQTIFNLLEIES